VALNRVFPPALAGLAAVLAAASASAQAPRELPLKHAPRPTVAAITPGDLMTRLYIIADDSMMGRRAGSVGNFKVTQYIAAQARAMGLEPAGENGTFFQTVPILNRRLDPAGALRVDGAPLALGTEYVPIPALSGYFPFGRAMQGAAVPVVFGGRLGGETITPEQAAGKLVVVLPPLGANGQPNPRFWGNGGLDRWPRAAGVAIAALEVAPGGLMDYINQPQTALVEPEDSSAAAPLGMLVSNTAAERLLGAPLAGLRPGAAGKTVAASVRFGDFPTEAPARNVVAVLRGRDPAVRGEYVAIGAHNDHLGLADEAVDHDSLRAYDWVMRPDGGNADDSAPTPAQAARIAVLQDSLHRAHAPRRDSIYNGADDDGSGTVTVMEIAQALASAPRKPRRSILFVWHTGEELGLYGSQHFTDHPTVPRDSIVAQLNMDMVGRGRAEDISGGGPRSLEIIGSRRLSTELGDIIDTLNVHRAQPMALDYQFDAPGHPYNRYCRSDHYMYARYGIPITFFSLGYHRDYHEVTDEPQYIDYDHMALVGSFVRDVALAVADRDHRIVRDHPLPDLHGTCKQ
jgi:hypothetical protein